MELIPFTLNVNGESRTVLAPNRKAAIIMCEKDFRRSNNLPPSVQVTATITGSMKAVAVTSGLVGVR